MRQKRTIDKILLTTAMLLIAAVFVSLLLRSEPKDPQDNRMNMTVPVVEEEILNVEGLIDRGYPDNELIILLDDIQAPVPEKLKTPAPTVLDEPIETTAPDTDPTTTSTEIVTTVDTSFREVDIRYYVHSEAGLNLRKDPSTQSTVIKKLEFGMAIRVIALSDDWAKVRLEGKEIGYVAKEFISQYPPVTTTTTTTTTPTTTVPVTTKPPTTATPTTTRQPATTGQGASSLKFVLSGSADSIAKANFKIIKDAGLVNKGVSSSINRHYENFVENEDGTITVDGFTIGYMDKYGQRFATHYDGVAVCRQQIKSSGGKCRLGHTEPANHNTGSGIPAQRGLVAVGASEIGIFPRGTVLFIRGYGFAVVADRSGGNLDLCYDADECKLLTRSNSVSAIYVIARP